MFLRTSTLHPTQSVLLLGARGTGKSTLVRSALPPDSPDVFWIDLLDEEQEDLYARDPKRLEREIRERSGRGSRPTVVIDEIQKVPRLLNTVHRLIESMGIRFVLTGSSARKLRKKGVNLLAGRAFVQHLFPLTSHELGSRFDLGEALRFGTLPKIFQLESEQDKERYLRSYALTYLKQEIQQEQEVRRLDPFRAFLEVAAQHNGKVLNFSGIARDVGVDYKTVQSHFQLLEDTLVGFWLPAYHRSIRKAQRAHPKFYFFDPGARNAMARALGPGLSQGAAAYGEAFEHWVVLELHRANAYEETDFRLSYWQSKEGREVDLVLDRPGRPPLLVEIKSTRKVDEREALQLDQLASEFGKEGRAVYLSQDPSPQRVGKTECLHWSKGIQRLLGSRSPGSVGARGMRGGA